MHFDMRELAATADPEPAVTGLSGWEGGLSQDDVLCVLADLGDERSGLVCVPPGWFGARIAGSVGWPRPCCLATTHIDGRGHHSRPSAGQRRGARWPRVSDVLYGHYVTKPGPSPYSGLVLSD